MDEKHLQHLLEKFLSGTANYSEKKELNEWYESQNGEDITWAVTSDTEEQNVEHNMRVHIQNHVSQNRTPIFKLNVSFFGKVAAVIVGVSILTGLYLYNARKADAVAERTISAVAPITYAENKYILLPDSSKVLLHPGSTIQYHFNGKTRELTLVGEAYFDIKHMADQAFVIHTGKVVTTVLGTAFVIKAYKGQLVSVSVTRGKVSVANEGEKMIAILTPGREVQYDAVTRIANQQNFKLKTAVTWVKADMQFDAMPFKILAEKLSHRYDVVFHFNNPALEKCLITGRFDGTESLAEVLHTISETMATTSTISGTTVNIDGAGCTQ